MYVARLPTPVGSAINLALPSRFIYLGIFTLQRLSGELERTNVGILAKVDFLPSSKFIVYLQSFIFHSLKCCHSFYHPRVKQSKPI